MCAAGGVGSPPVGACRGGERPRGERDDRDQDTRAWRAGVGDGGGTVGLGVGSGGSVAVGAGAEVQAVRSARVAMTRRVDFMDRFKAIGSSWLRLFFVLNQRFNLDFNKPFRVDIATHLIFVPHLAVPG